jgi:hypothetical protein
VDDFIYVVHLETIIPALFAGFLTGVTLFTTFKLSVQHYYLLALVQLIFGVVGITTRYLENAEFGRFAGVIFLYYIFLGSAILGQKLYAKIKTAPYLSNK